LENIRKDQQKLTEPDPLKDMIETLFCGHVGPDASAQAEIGAINDSAENGAYWKYLLDIGVGGHGRSRPSIAFEAIGQSKARAPFSLPNATMHQTRNYLSRLNFVLHSSR